VKTIGFWAAIIMPLWDIPLIMRIISRKSSQDISLGWIVGLWSSSVLMAPSSFITGDKIAMGFNTVNVTLLTAVLIAVFKYRKGPSGV
jgi:uncharacterized protein with PQ loop repeat